MNQKRLRVSLVIPAYNEERHLAACLQAIAAQTVQPFEVIVVDNGCTDSTVAIARTFPFVRVVHEAKQGVVYARNAGFNGARGDIIGRIDADIALPHTWVAHVTDFYANPAHASQAWSGGGFFYNVRFPHVVSWAYSLLAFRLNLLLIGHYTLWGSNMALLKTQWQQVATTVHTRLGIHEDLDLAMHLHDVGVGITYDTAIKTRAQLRRVQANRHELWEYLQWWPRTLRLHRKPTWVICWFFGAFLLYGAALLLAATDWLARKMGRAPLPPGDV